MSVRTVRVIFVAITLITCREFSHRSSYRLLTHPYQRSLKCLSMSLTPVVYVSDIHFFGFKRIFHVIIILAVVAEDSLEYFSLCPTNLIISLWFWHSYGIKLSSAER